MSLNPEHRGQCAVSAESLAARSVGSGAAAWHPVTVPPLAAVGSCSGLWSC